MATIVAFTPSPDENFQFQPTLDGQAYNAVVTWNLFAQRYYLNLFTLQFQRVFSLPLIGSPPNYDISLTEGYFTTTLVYRAASAQFEIGD